MGKPIAGVIPVVHTPFDDNDCIIQADLRREIDWAFDQGADGICTGMVSEILRLSESERLELTDMMVDMAAGRGVVVASVGAESTKEAIHYARRAEQAGCDAVMAIPPISTALPHAEVFDYFHALARSIDLPLIVQDASAYVGKSIDLRIHVQLLQEYGPQKVLFKPEAAPLGPNLSALRDATGGRARILEGSGGISLVDSYRRGIVGTIPGMDLLDAIVALWKSLASGDEYEIYRLYLPVCAMVALQMQAGLDGFLAIEKYILVKRGIFTTDNRRGPLAWRMDQETRAEVDRLLALLVPQVSAGS